LAAAGKRVLVVEDESLISLLIEEFLGELGYHVVGTAADLEQALTMSRTLDLDFVVLDLNLDGELSYPIAKVLRERGVPFLFATGYGLAALPQELRDVPVLAKPFRREELDAALRQAAGAERG
jgi:CheY-like chemotaxis protein